MNGNQATKHVFGLGSRYPREIAIVRVALGVYLLALTIVVFNSGHGSAWGFPLIAVQVLNFCLGYRLVRLARKHSDRPTPVH